MWFSHRTRTSSVPVLSKSARLHWEKLLTCVDIPQILPSQFSLEPPCFKSIHVHYSFFKSMYLWWCTDTPQRILLGFHATHRNPGRRAACNRICTCWVSAVQNHLLLPSAPSLLGLQIHRARFTYRDWFSFFVCILLKLSKFICEHFSNLQPPSEAVTMSRCI